MTKDGGRHARQNVIHEVGFFQGRLGRSKVVLVVEKGVEIPSNLSGLFYLEYEKDIKESFVDLQIILDAGDASASAKKLDADSLGKFAKEMGSMDQSWIRSIAKEFQPYVDLPPDSFFAVTIPILQKHAEGYAKQAEQFNAGARSEEDKPENETGGDAKALGALIGFAGAMLIGPSERLADLCRNAVTIMENASQKPQGKDQAKAAVLRMFGPTE